MAESMLAFGPQPCSHRGLCLIHALGYLAVVFVLSGGSTLGRPQSDEQIQDITAKYHFISAEDTLGILEEEGKLKGYVDVNPGEEESDTVLSYTIIQGQRKKQHVEFRTNQIHRKYYRFFGRVERGSGHEEGDPDYLRLVGDLETVTVKGDSGEESVQGMHMVLKSFGKDEREEE